MKYLTFISIIFLVISGFLISFNAIAEENADVTADEEITAEDLGVADPQILPDSPWYSLKNFWRGIRTILTFNPVKKAEFRLEIANQKLIEAKKLAEKTGEEEIFQTALENYQREMERIKNRVEKFKEKAADNPKIDEFLNRYTSRIVLHQRLMDRLQQKFSDNPERLQQMEKIQGRIMEHFGEILNKLEDKDKIPERLEQVLENIEGSKYKNFKNLEILLELENKVPEEAKEAIRQAQENALKRLHGDLNNMSPEDQEKFKDYLEKISGDQTTHLEIIERLKEKELPDVLKEKIEQNKERLQRRIQKIKGTCEDLCGDGICQEIVCLAIGCPCAETKTTCPQDCK